ncbi:MAG: hypothetical protein ACRDEA_15330, partial [Microcystaceae cyanobacterium]
LIMTLLGLSRIRLIQLQVFVEKLCSSFALKRLPEALALAKSLNPIFSPSQRGLIRSNPATKATKKGSAQITLPAMSAT